MIAWGELAGSVKQFGSNLLRWLFEPSAVVGEKRRNRVRLLSVFLFFLVFISLNGSISLQLSGNQQWLIMRLLAGLFAAGYLVSRTRYYRVAVVMGIAIPAITPAFIFFVIGDRSSIFGTLAWLVMPLIIASLMLSLRSIIIAIVSYFVYVIFLLIMARAPVDAVSETVAFFAIVSFFLGAIAALFRHDQIVIEEYLGERLRAEIALKESEDFGSVLMSNLLNPILVINPDGSLREVNPAMEKLSGFTREELIGHKPPYPWWRGDRLDRLGRNLSEARTKGMYRYEGLFQTKNGHDLWVDLSTVPIMTGGDLRFYISIWMDITERKQAEEKLRQLDRMKADFISNVSHELRAPVHTISGFAKIMLEDKGLDDSARGEFLSIIARQSTHLSNLIDDILDISRLESGRFEIHRQRMCLDTVIREVVEDFGSLASEKGAVIAENIPEDVPEIMADEKRIKQVIANLISNAIKFGDTDNSINVVCMVAEGELLVKVVDHGIGIPEDAMSNLFEKFYRVDAGGARGGTGLGLNISKQIIESHGGRIWAESAVSCGSTFCFTLPRG